MRLVFAAIAICAVIGWADGTAFGQSSEPDKLKAYIAQLDRLDAQAKAAFDREMAREKAAEKAGECPDAMNTRAIVNCLAGEVATTRKNFQVFASTIRAILALDGLDAKDVVPGPTGTPLTRDEQLQRFDEVAAAWEKYRQAQCAEAYDLLRGGTMAPIAGATCELALLRSHMREMDRIYDNQLRHH
jgi:hypothetical protein